MPRDSFAQQFISNFIRGREAKQSKEANEREEKASELREKLFKHQAASEKLSRETAAQRADIGMFDFMSRVPGRTLTPAAETGGITQPEPGVSFPQGIPEGFPEGIAQMLKGRQMAPIEGAPIPNRLERTFRPHELRTIRGVGDQSDVQGRPQTLEQVVSHNIQASREKARTGQESKLDLERFKSDLRIREDRESPPGGLGRDFFEEMEDQEGRPVSAFVDPVNRIVRDLLGNIRTDLRPIGRRVGVTKLEELFDDQSNFLGTYLVDPLGRITPIDIPGGGQPGQARVGAVKPLTSPNAARWLGYVGMKQLLDQTKPLLDKLARGPLAGRAISFVFNNVGSLGLDDDTIRAIQLLELFRTERAFSTGGKQLTITELKRIIITAPKPDDTVKAAAIKLKVLQDFFFRGENNQFDAFLVGLDPRQGKRLKTQFERGETFPSFDTLFPTIPKRMQVEESGAPSGDTSTLSDDELRRQLIEELSKP